MDASRDAHLQPTMHWEPRLPLFMKLKLGFPACESDDVTPSNNDDRGGVVITCYIKSN